MAMRLIGTWDIVSSSDFDDTYLNEEGAPYIQLRKDGDRIAGQYRIGLQNGTLDGRPQRDGSILFGFDGMDEMEEVYGAASAILAGCGKMLLRLNLALPAEWGRRIW